LSIAKANNDKSGIAAAYSHIGAIELKRDNVKSANVSFKRCMELINKSDSNQEYAMLSIDIANLFYDKRKYDSALKYYENGIKALMELQNRPDLKPSSFWQKYILKDTISEHLQESIQEFSQTTILQDKLAKIYNRIGNIFRIRGNWLEAINNHERTLEIFRGIGDLKKIALAYTDLGIDYSNSGDSEKALYYYQKCYGLLKGTDELIGLAVTLSNIGKIYENSNNFKRALSFYKRSLKVSQKARYKTGMKKAYQDLGQIYKKNNDISKSNKYFELSRKL
jgi:tetratricopeptide (TPR) repeat protein